MAAHNEEKLIDRALTNLFYLPYKDYEVIIGLDGCTDKTEEIVNSFEERKPVFKHFNFNLRQGKPAVINKLAKKAKGDILIIHDADWIFKVKNKEALEKYLSAFNVPVIGGIAESFPVEEPNKGNWVYRMVAWSSLFWIQYNKLNDTMLLTNVLRRKLFKENSSLGDDFERTKDITDAGYTVVTIESPEEPRMVASYDKIKFRDFFKQKIRTAVARKQLGDKGKPVSFSYYLNSCEYILCEGFKHGKGTMMTIWIALTALATLISKFKKIDTREGWNMRAER